ncbi:MAG: PEP-utilizing enzyme [Candidatus Diapherotrites archaeon]|nr:PEP-utilizing enzyme [Candidatus Diapherotrites archaeon]
MKSAWKDIIAAGKRVAETEEFEISQTGRVNGNFLTITQEHKLLTFEEGGLVKKEIGNVCREKGFLCLVDRLPELEPRHEPELAYTAGAIFTDGHICLKKTKGSVTFIQKATEEKKQFFEKIKSSFKKAFDLDFTYSRTRTTHSFIRDRAISGQVTDLICFKRQPAALLSELRENQAEWALALDEESTLEFLAGVLDGDGAFSNNRIQLYVSNEGLAQAITVSCLKLGIVPQVTVNRNIYNIQIVERLEDILAHSARIKAKSNPKKYGSKLFSIKQVLPKQEWGISNKGRTKAMLQRNLLIDSNKLARDYLPFCSGASKAILRQILNSDLRMYRLSRNQNRKTTHVYNFEVNSENELDKNFVAFSSRYSPVLVSNSHAAVVARGMGKPCVSGCEKIKVDLKEKNFTAGGHKVKEGDFVTIDGLSGEVMLGKANLIDPEMSKSMRTILRWADRIRALGVRANADTPEDAKRARDFGAEGIGLCRTEHMFMQQERLPVVREMIMAAGDKERRKALAKLLPMQRSDFLGIFKAMNGLPVVIRLLDPPLHEFLPDRLELTKNICELEAIGAKGKKLDDLRKLYKKASDLSEKNPMLGFRGCRLGILYPEIYEMQVQAIFEAACEAQKQGFKVFPNVMIPLVGHESEIGQLSVLVSGIAERTMEKARKKIAFKVGTMIELPRACLIAEKIAKHVSFFSFGTNDLTQTTLGISRDDAEVLFLEHYVDQGVIQDNPFMVLDSEGVGKLIRMAVADGRKNNKKLSVGICGEHGGDPRSIAFCQGAGIDYVSCSPFRVPIARLAAAQAALSEKNGSRPGQTI